MDLNYLKNKDKEFQLTVWRYMEDLQDKYPYLQWGWTGFGPMVHEGGY